MKQARLAFDKFFVITIFGKLTPKAKSVVTFGFLVTLNTPLFIYTHPPEES